MKFTTQQLVSFGNFLLDRKGSGEVSDADIASWAEKEGLDMEKVWKDLRSKSAS